MDNDSELGMERERRPLNGREFNFVIGLVTFLCVYGNYWLRDARQFTVVLPHAPCCFFPVILLWNMPV